MVMLDVFQDLGRIGRSNSQVLEPVFSTQKKSSANEHLRELPSALCSGGFMVAF